MKHAIAGILLLVGMGVAPALAYDGGLHRDIRHDERKIARDRHELRRDLRNGNYAPPAMSAANSAGNTAI